MSYLQPLLSYACCHNAPFPATHFIALYMDRFSLIVYVDALPLLPQTTSPGKHIRCLVCIKVVFILHVSGFFVGCLHSLHCDVFAPLDVHMTICTKNCVFVANIAFSRFFSMFDAFNDI